MKTKQKGFTLIELIVVMAIIAILVLIAAPKFMGYTEKAKLTQVINDIKASEKSAEQYYLKNEAWPRDPLATPYSDEQLTLWVDEFKNLSGETFTLEDGDYYDVDWNLMKPFMAKPENDFKYIIQNPVGDIYYAYELTPAGEITKFAGEVEVTTEPTTEEVTNPPVILAESIDLTSPKTTINVGETLQLSASVLPANTTDKSLTWSSSNTAVATVNESGLVTALTGGNTTLSVTSGGINKTISISVVLPNDANNFNFDIKVQNPSEIIGLFDVNKGSGSVTFSTDGITMSTGDGWNGSFISNNQPLKREGILQVEYDIVYKNIYYASASAGAYVFINNAEKYSQKNIYPSYYQILSDGVYFQTYGGSGTLNLHNGNVMAADHPWAMYPKNIINVGTYYQLFAPTNYPSMVLNTVINYQITFNLDTGAFIYKQNGNTISTGTIAAAYMTKLGNNVMVTFANGNYTNQTSVYKNIKISTGN